MFKPFKKSTRLVESNEWPLLLLSGLFAFGSVALAIFIRTWSDTIFLTHFSVNQIPTFYIWSALIFAPTTIGYAWLNQRYDPVRLNTATLLVFSIFSLFCLKPVSSSLVLFALLLLMSLVSPLVNAICWGLILERLNSRQSKRLIPLIGSSATAGAAISGTFGAEVIEWGGNEALMSLICLTLIMLAPFPHLLLGGRVLSESSHTHDKLEAVKTSDQESTQQQDTQQQSARQETELKRMIDGLRALVNNRLLRVSAIATFLMAIATNLIDYLFKVILDMSLSSNELGPFFARFHAFTNFAILSVQLFLLSPALRTFGLRWSFSFYPLSLLIIGIACLGPMGGILGFWAFTGLRGVDTLMKFTFHSTTENLLLTPVPYIERAQSKVFLKGVIYPMGGLIAGVLISSVTIFTHSFHMALVLMLVITLFWMWSTTQVHQHYIGQLSDNLSIHLGERDVDHLTRKDGNKELKHLIPLFQQSPQAHSLQTLFHEIGRTLGYSHLGEQINNMWIQLDDNAKADLIEWLDQLLKKEHIKGVGIILERDLKREKRALNVANS